MMGFAEFDTAAGRDFLSIFRKPFQWVARAAARRAEIAARRDLTDLLSLDDHLLRDMGLTRDDIWQAVNLPPDADAGETLNRAAGRSS